MKRLIKRMGVLFCAVLLIGALAATASAATVASGTCGDNLTWVLDDAGTLTISGSGPMPDAEDPSEMEWYPYKDSVHKVVINYGVTGIGKAAFSGYDMLTGVSIPGSVTGIGCGAFKDCSSLTAVQIPYGIERIEDTTFRGCSKLERVSIPESVTSIGMEAFYLCTNLKSITLSAGVNSIGVRAFGYTGLTELVIPAGIEKITSVAFYGCSNLTKVTIPGTVTEIGTHAFGECSKLSDVTIGQGVKTIGGSAFGFCSSLTAITIPDSVVTIGDYAFGSCSALKSITFKGNAPSFEDNNADSVSETFSKVVATVYYPAGNTTWTSVNMRNYGGQLTWVAEGEAAPDAPIIQVSNNASTGKPKISWNKVDGAVKYELYWAPSKSGTYTRIGTSTGTSLTNKSAKTGKMYYYKVKAVDANGNKSEFSNVVNRTCDIPQPVIKATNIASTGKVKLSWEPIEGAVKYELYRATSKNGTYTKIGTTKNSYITNTSGVAGTLYYYKIRALHGTNSGAHSAFSNIVERSCDLAQPVVTVSLNSAGNPKLTWGAVEGAIKYRVYRATSKDGTYSLIYTTRGTTCTNIKNVEEGQTYYYKVRAYCDNSGATSAYSAIKYITAK